MYTMFVWWEGIMASNAGTACRVYSIATGVEGQDEVSKRMTLCKTMGWDFVLFRTDEDGKRHLILTYIQPEV